MKIEKFFLQAAKLALTDGKKSWFHAAIGIRADGTIVCSRNGEQGVPTPRAHAEVRLCRKLGKDAPLVIVVRVNKQGEFRISKPCKNCQKALTVARVKKVMWSTSDGTYESMKL